MLDRGELKRGQILVFEGGVLQIDLEGYGEANGSGRFLFDEDDVEWKPHDEKAGCYLEVKIPRSELTALRDILNKLFPADAAKSDSGTPS